MRGVEKSFTRFATVVLIAAGSIGLNACSASSSAESSKNHGLALRAGDSTAVAGLTVANSSSGEYNAADVEFVTAMVAHHAQAIEMVQLVLGRTSHVKVRKFAKRLEATQTPEIVKLYGLLKGWDQRPINTATPMVSEAPMSGMLSDADLEALRSASKATVEDIFLTQISKHHEGAIAMAENELTSGINPQAKVFAQSLKQSQTAEISKLQALKVSIS
ncbi:MAG TPA: DUF305 domain-containing protein [Kineosporiaceae bacterium]|nr:DUF305 domain-containing protein [Kineosporiaceae bacterium]